MVTLEYYDGFNKSHTLAYSLVALQEMNLAFKFPIIYWNTACLITDTGGSEDISGKGNDYDKLAAGINKMRDEGVQVSLPNINLSTYTFKPDEEKNRIIFGLRGAVGVGDAVIDEIINNRPYKSFNDFLEKNNFSKTVNISLIKAGAFDDFDERKNIMKSYLMKTCGPKKNLTLQNLKMLMEKNLLPRDGEYAETRKIYEFNRYLKAKCQRVLDTRAINFLTEQGYDDIINSDLSYNQIKWKSLYDIYIDKYREYIKQNKEVLLTKLNNELFLDEWNKYASGNYSSWEMETLCFYYHDHELKNVNYGKYGLRDFYSIQENPIVDKVYNFRGREIKTFKLDKICGTCISKNKNNGMIKLLTVDGVVDVRLGKEFLAIYDKQISARGSDGVKHVIEKSWFTRGSLLLIQGIRSGDQFIAKKYKNVGSIHRLMKITEIEKDGDLILQSERVQGD